ncbi:leucine-rich repeat domain-containing protein [Chryseobacterium aquaticum]|uniref:Leucine-rich repeat domain-containing protein n=1 Tax=Chryseobacterium aquaticum TaxID=452084 RepID=A0A848N374_9FLAO|nr:MULTISPECIES: leucine-rich repeat domain-containing protein [Chryseobacterium]NMR35597.1 leucine-rich repeat domain-containing protein [Chryseobacterium aquaticum]NRQ47672.1 leucine-rich repeat domain-containing protein [Chryseobacterium sp. C-204]
MKTVSKLSFFFIFLGIMISSQEKYEFKSIKEANVNPEKVLRLNLIDETENIENIDWKKFKNLEYLSLKNLHLKGIPNGIGLLPKLKILDVSGNDFKFIPSNFTQLTMLEELFLNDEKNIDFSQNIDVISKIKSLKILHIENDGLKKLPPNFWKLNYLESVYLNNNQLKEFNIPKNKINNLKNIYLDNNLFVPSDMNRLNSQYGTLLRF